MTKSREKRDIEWLVSWALEKNGGDDGLSSRSEPIGLSGAGNRLAMMQQLGTIVQVSRNYGVVRDAHPDAQVIVTAIGEMYADVRIADVMALVYQHGLRRDRPDWGQMGCGRYELVRNEVGTAKKRYVDQRHARGLLGFNFNFHGYSVEEIEFMMVQYLGWRDALAAVRDRINQKTTRYEATGPSAPAAPWDVPEPIIHKGEGGTEEVHNKAIALGRKV